MLLHLLHSYGTYQTVLKIQNLSLCYLFLGVSRLILSPKSALNLKKENAISFLAKNLILILIILCHIGPIPAFRPRFAGKCDDTTLLVVTISRLNQLLITPSPSWSWILSWDNTGEKYSVCFRNLFVIFQDFNPTHSASRASALPTRPHRP